MWSLLDRGGFSEIFCHSENKNKVIKTFRDDDAYLYFLDIIKSNSNNIHFPKIINTIKEFDILHGKIFLIELELLLKIDKNSFEEIVKNVNSKTSLHNTIRFLEKNKTKYKMDLHKCNNFMRRENNDIVIIDPYMTDYDKIDKQKRREQIPHILEILKDF
jgi:hypothetical protein